MSDLNVNEFAQRLRKVARATRDSGELFGRSHEEWRGRAQSLALQFGDKEKSPSQRLDLAAALVVALLMSEEYEP